MTDGGIMFDPMEKEWPILELPTRVFCRLMRLELKLGQDLTIRQVDEMSNEELLADANFGRVSLRQLRGAIGRYRDDARLATQAAAQLVESRAGVV
jgi:hypothetical protein